MENLIDMEKVTVTFPGVIALNEVSFQLRPSEVHVILGENGAGKSTLVKILSGINTPSSGSVTINGKKYSKLSPHESSINKISIIYQELSVINELSIAENLFVGKLPSKKILGIGLVDYSFVNNKAKQLLEKIGLKRDPSTLVKDISISEKQQVEIAKALAADSKIIIMDEPTSSLSIEETQNLFRIIRQLRTEGIGVIYISHKLDEIKQIADRITVLKDGKYVGTRNAEDVEISDMISMMVGRELKNKYINAGHHHLAAKEVIFSVENMTRKDGSVRNVSFELYKGEILGFAGLIGAGRSELMEGIFGAKPISSGKMVLNGKPLTIRSPFEAVKKGIAFITENRRETGFFHNFEIWREISVMINLKKSKLGGITGLTHSKNEKKIADQEVKRLNTKCSSVEQMTVNLSGGNQQKVIISKWLAVDSDLFILDEPTKGIDVSAKSEIYNIVRKMVDEGKGIIIVSSELPELLSVCDRIIVFHEGEMSAIYVNDNLSEETIMHAATAANK